MTLTLFHSHGYAFQALEPLELLLFLHPCFPAHLPLDRKSEVHHEHGNVAICRAENTFRQEILALSASDARRRDMNSFDPSSQKNPTLLLSMELFNTGSTG
jgi:hypothetical protein